MTRYRPFTRAFVGERFGRLVVLSRDSKRLTVRCDCGVEKPVLICNIARTKSCGCLAREVCGKNRRRHGGTGSAEYRAWASMKCRCMTPSSGAYKYYGGRGISVAPEWLGPDGFARFLAHVGARPSPKHSLDRYPNNDGNYEPGNVRWATDTEQARNTRRNVWLEHDGKRMLATDWAKQLGISRQAIEIRIRKGWSDEKICTTPAPMKLVAALRGRVPGSKLYVLDGVRDTLAGWARRTGLPWKVIANRLRSGRSMAEAVSTGRLRPRGKAA